MNRFRFGVVAASCLFLLSACTEGGLSVAAGEECPEGLAASECFGINWKTATAADIAGVDVNAREKGGDTPLHWAAKNSNPGVVRALLDGGGDVQARNIVNMTPLHSAAVGGGHPEVIGILIDAGANLEAQIIDQSTPLLAAAVFNDNPDIIRALIAEGANLDARDNHNATALNMAAGLNGNPAVLRALIESGADLEARDKIGATPLHYAAQENNADIILTLLNAGSNPKAKTDNGETAKDLLQYNKKLTPADLEKLNGLLSD